MKITVLGLSITSSWGNGHATTYRSLLKALSKLGHDVVFLERDKPWYAENRDMPSPSFAKTHLYDSLDQLSTKYRDRLAASDLVIVGSYVPEGIEVGWRVLEDTTAVVAFYDIDTPITLAKVRQGGCDYISQDLIQSYDLYLSFTGGPVLEVLEHEFGSRLAKPLYCSVDTELYQPARLEKIYDLGYLGTYSDDRQATVERLLLEPAKRLPCQTFVVAGPSYPQDVAWPSNVRRIEHLEPSAHSTFYNRQRFTLNVTRREMITTGYAPSVRLFEAAACGIPIVSDWWEGLDTFFQPGEEILIASESEQMLDYLQSMSDRKQQQIGSAAMRRALQQHTSTCRAKELERAFQEALNIKRSSTTGRHSSVSIH